MCKCRCGSDDKLEFKDGIFMRIKDQKPHYCEYHPKIDSVSGGGGGSTTGKAGGDAKNMTVTHELIDDTKQQRATQQKAEITNAYNYIKTIEDTLLECDMEFGKGELSKNGNKLGMWMKMADNIIRGEQNDL